uniref:Putative secreted protein n=1 Tax=Anopheles darlingi TaxID=43151 RepID=A0A2M4DC80_ANODA
MIALLFLMRCGFLVASYPVVGAAGRPSVDEVAAAAAADDERRRRSGMPRGKPVFPVHYRHTHTKRGERALEHTTRSTPYSFDTILSQIHTPSIGLFSIGCATQSGTGTHSLCAMHAYTDKTFQPSGREPRAAAASFCDRVARRSICHSILSRSLRIAK